VIVLKKIVFSLFLSIICLILISEKTFAAENPTNLKTLSENLTIEIYSDGRVAPIKDANKLTEEELNKVLVEIVDLRQVFGHKKIKFFCTTTIHGLFHVPSRLSK
jgi:maltose-binding protein MalE